MRYLKGYWGRRISGLDSHHRALDLWGRSKVVSSYLHDVLNLGQQLHIHGQATIQRIAWLGYQS